MADSDNGHAAAFKGAAMDYRSVADLRLVADLQREALVADVQHGAILHGGALADANEVDVAAGDHVEPEGTVDPGLEVAAQEGAGRDEGAATQSGKLTAIVEDRHRQSPGVVRTLPAVSRGRES